MIKYIKDSIQKKSGTCNKKRSSTWRIVRRVHITLHSNCAVCNSTKKLEVHHILPFHSHPQHELDPDNLITLCENKKYGINCHLLIGHLGNYRKINLNIAKDIKTWRGKLVSDYIATHLGSEDLKTIRRI